MIKNRLYGMSIYNLDGLTLQELLCQFFDLISQCVDDVNKYTEMVENLLKWIHEEGLKNEVLELMDKWKNDGTLQEIINEKIFNDLNTKIENRKTEITNFKDEVNTNFENLTTEFNNKFEGFKTQYSEKINKNESDILEIKKTKNATTFYILNNTKAYGDCILIQADDGSYSMIDTGWEEDYLGFIDQLDKIGLTKLKYLFITHSHSDHIGNAPRFIEKYKPDYLVTKDGIDWNRVPSIEIDWNTKQYHMDMINACTTHGTQVIYANDQEFLIGKTDKVKAYNSKFYDYEDFNGMSITYILNSQNTYSMFTGDSNARAENNIISSVPKCEFMKLSHHGGVGGNQYSYIKKVSPRYGFINRFYNTGANNTMKDNGVKVIDCGGELYSNDNNSMGVFKIENGVIYPKCNKYIIPLWFIEVATGKYKLTNEGGEIATNGIYRTNNNKFYYVKPDGLVADENDGWQLFQGIYYLANSDNSLKRNMWAKDKDNGRYYWINDKCEVSYNTGFVYDKNEMYILDGNGCMVVDSMIDYNGYHYYCLSSGKIVVDDWYESSSGWVYANGQGHLVNGRYFINGRWYTFSNYICDNPNNGEPPDYIVTG